MSENEVELKIWPMYFEDVKSGRKEFELRKNDRNFKVGQIIKFREFQLLPTPNSDDRGYYTGRETEKKIKYLLVGVAGIDTDYAILGLEGIINIPPKEETKPLSVEDIHNIFKKFIEEFNIRMYIGNSQTAGAGIMLSQRIYNALEEIRDNK